MVEFIETFEAHHSLAGDRNAPVSMEEWIDYYTSISALIEADDSFHMLLSNTYGMTHRAAPVVVKQPAAPIVSSEEVRETMKGKTVYRSGMGSEANPLNNTKEYYPPVNNATRSGQSGNMFANIPVVDPTEQKPKDQFANYVQKPV